MAAKSWRRRCEWGCRTTAQLVGQVLRLEEERVETFGLAVTQEGILGDALLRPVWRRHRMLGDVGGGSGVPIDLRPHAGDLHPGGTGLGLGASAATSPCPKPATRLAPEGGTWLGEDERPFKPPQSVPAAGRCSRRTPVASALAS